MPHDDADLERLAALGPFFAVRVTVDGDGWRRLRELTEPNVLDARVTHVASVLSQLSGAPTSSRVAASTLSLGLFARLVSPVLGAAVLGIRLPRLTLDSTWWQAVSGGPLPLAVAGPPSSPDVEALLAGVVTPLAAVLSGTYALSGRVLRGNAASAVFGAADMIGWVRPDLHRAAIGLGIALLDGPLSGTGSVNGRFVRASCCLYYRIPGGGFCRDCVLARRSPLPRPTRWG